MNYPAVGRLPVKDNTSAHMGERGKPTHYYYKDPSYARVMSSTSRSPRVLLLLFPSENRKITVYFFPLLHCVRCTYFIGKWRPSCLESVCAHLHTKCLCYMRPRSLALPFPLPLATLLVSSPLRRYFTHLQDE